MPADLHSPEMVVARHVLVLAAGKGTRMRTSRPKVSHRLAGRRLIDHVLDAAATLRPATTTLVVGHQADAVEHDLSDREGLTFVHQQPQLGTAHALLQAETALADATGSLLVLSGDVPRIQASTLATLIETHERTGAAATVVTADVERPYGYGRVIRRDGALLHVVEEVDATPAERQITEINSGIYAFALEPLFKTLAEIPEAGPKHERYLPALFHMYRRRGLSVETVTAADANEIRGINSQTELAEMKRMVNQTKNEELMAGGVTIEDPATTYVDRDVVVGADTVIHPGVTLQGRTTIGERCEIHSGVRLVDTIVGDAVTINNFCVITDTRIAAGAQVGPFAHLRPGTSLGEKAQVGNFVELKKTTLGPGSKANHLSYVGDATVGAGTNIGAGTITCNYDGITKSQTTVGDGVFIGSGTQLVAPVSLGDDAYVGAGSCITDDVPAGALAVARGRQVNKDGWVSKRRAK
jgi:bifunctional UDP-N-acetylglucosamine pyrophosphorylase/glucosamine-1-phosphate N-acetyltransferase